MSAQLVAEYLRQRLTRGLRRHRTLADANSASHQRSRGLIGKAKELFDDWGDAIEDTFEDTLGWVLSKIIALLIDDALDSSLAQLLADWLKKEMPEWIDEILGIFVEGRHGAFSRLLDVRAADG